MCCKKGVWCKGYCGCTTSKVAQTLVLVGALNWGLVGLGIIFSMNWNLVSAIFGFSPTLEALVYVLVGVSAVVGIFGCKCAKCKNGVCDQCVGGEKCTACGGDCKNGKCVKCGMSCGEGKKVGQNTEAKM